MRIFDPVHPVPDQPGLGPEFPATAGKRFVDWAEFIAAEPYDIPPDDAGENDVGLARTRGRKSLNPGGLLQFLPEGNHVEPG